MNDKNNYNDYVADDEEMDDSCDLDPSKTCDNCGKCIEPSTNFKVIKITHIERPKNDDETD